MARAHNPDACTPQGAGIIVPEGYPQEDVDALDAYFSRFAEPIIGEHYGHKYEHCLNCGEAFGGMSTLLGDGVLHRWDICHGDARCTGCGWPSCGIHYVKRADGSEICSLRNRFLQYHPDGVYEAGKSDETA